MIKLELERLRELKVDHSEVYVIKEQSTKIEDQEKKIIALSQSLHDLQEDVSRTYEYYQKVLDWLKKEIAEIAEKEKAWKEGTSK